VTCTLDHTAEPNPQWTGASPDSASSAAPYRLYNIGNNQPVELMYYIEVSEDNLGKTGEGNLVPLQRGDGPGIYADVEDIINDVTFKPEATVEKGVARFLELYTGYYRV